MEEIGENTLKPLQCQYNMKMTMRVGGQEVCSLSVETEEE